MSRFFNCCWISGGSWGRGEEKKRAIRQLFAEQLEQRDLLTTVTGVDPLPSSHSAPVSTNVTVTFDQNINADTATPQNLVVHTRMKSRPVTVSAAGATVTADTALDLFPGEVVQVTATSGIQSTAADPVVPRVWQFRAASPTGTGVFTDSGQSPGNSASGGVSLGDLDGDGDLDAFVPKFSGEADRVWLNNGGVFSDTGQSLGDHWSAGAELGDLDSDGDLDAYVTAWAGKAIASG